MSAKFGLGWIKFGFGLKFGLLSQLSCITSFLQTAMIAEQFPVQPQYEGTSYYDSKTLFADISKTSIMTNCNEKTFSTSTDV